MPPKKHPVIFGHTTSDPIGFHKDVVNNQRKMMFSKKKLLPNSVGVTKMDVNLRFPKFPLPKTLKMLRPRTRRTNMFVTGNGCQHLCCVFILSPMRDRSTLFKVSHGFNSTS